MRVLFLTALAVFSLQHLVWSQVDLSYYLPKDISYDQSIPTPEEIIGHEVGEWHVSHDKLVNYMYAVSEASDRVTIREYARTFENRPLLVLTITNPDNHNNIDEIRKQHVKLTDPNNSSGLNVDDMPAVLYMGYSVHGNEASGSNASLVAAYHLAAGQGPEMNKLLSNTVILLDPSYNPDGLNRFASWVNSHKSKNLVTDPNNLEQNEAWPRGRTNHYWFDLNRDWLPVQMPESQGRIETFHSWKPNVLTDHHEMGTNSTYFFQPGIPTRNHPLTPKSNYILTEKIAQYHARYLDEIKSLYYAKESFDDFYYGKGSTFPDVNGGVGILFEQASSRGHAQESVNGILRFPFAIKNHFTTTLSTMNAVVDLRTDLLNHQRDFFKNAIKDAGKDFVKAYVFGGIKDEGRTAAFLEILKRQQIDCHALAKKTSAEGVTYHPENGYVVPVNQKQYKLIKAIFEKRTSFEDSLFYDVSAWTLPLAFNIPYAAMGGKNFDAGIIGDKVNPVADKEGKVIGKSGGYAYAFEWHDYFAPKLLSHLHSKNMNVKVALEPFTSGDGKTFDRGTILIASGIQKYDAERLHELLTDLSRKCGVDIFSLSTGYTSGVNLGSPNFRDLKKVKGLIIAGDRVNSYDVGEVWHLLDQRVDLAMSQVTIDKFNSIDLNKYNTVVMTNGRYSKLNAEKLKTWVSRGGLLITMKDASKWVSDKGISTIKYKKVSRDSTQKELPYNMLSRYRGAQFIGGAIFNAKLDLTHPLAFGYTRKDISIFRNGRLFMETSKNPYANPVRYTSRPLASGYISKENLSLLSNSPAIGVSIQGKGKIVSFTDNPNFRAFWYGTNKLFLNSLFFGSLIEANSAK